MFPFLATIPTLPPLPQASIQQNPVEKSKENILLEKILKEAESVSLERTYGDCKYAWGSWKLSSTEVRTTVRTCRGVTERVAVSCPALRLNVESAGKWGEWRRPAGKEANMMAALCAHLVKGDP